MTSAAYRRAARAVAPDDRIVDCLELAHPDLAEPARVAASAGPLEVDGATFAAGAFEAVWPEEGGRRAPKARIAIDNVGQPLTQWIEATQGAQGGRCRLMRVLASTGAIEEEAALDVGDVEVGTERIEVELGFGLSLARPAVLWRHDPRRSPGLF